MLFYVSDESEFESPFRAGSQQVVAITSEEKENHDTRRIFIFDVAIKKSSPLLPRICEGPKKSMGSEQEAIS